MFGQKIAFLLRAPGAIISGRGERSRPVALAILLFTAAAFFIWFVNPFYPLQHWLIFYYMRAWLGAGLFSVASLVGGLRVLQFVIPESESLPIGDRLILAWALGVLAFFWGVFLAGTCGLFGGVFFFAWPLALLLLGGAQGTRLAMRDWLHLRSGVRLCFPRSPVEVLSVLLILLSLTAIYLQVMIPNNLGADTNAYHIPIAEHYVAAGRIVPFAEGWYAGAYPQLTSVLYAWALQTPGTYADGAALCSHVEWALFLPTLAGVAVLAGRLTRRRPTPFSVAAVFLFPGLFLYDSSLITGADHVLAFWAPPLALALLRLSQCFSWRNAVLAGLLSAALMLTKLTGLHLFAPAALFVLLLAVRARRITPLLAWGASALLASSAYWLKNWIYYGDPMYPLLHRFLPSHPWHEGAGDLLSAVFTPQFEATGTPVEKLIKTLKVLLNFSFVPNDWGFHADKPVFGSLFTLLIPTLFFLRPLRRLWVLVLGTHVGVALWYLTNHQDRYLQALLPWMAACVAAMLALAWRQGRLVRAGVVALVAAQLVWGSDVYFFRTHAMLHDSPIRALGEFLGAAHQKHYRERFERPGSLLEVGDALPAKAKALVHVVEEKLGARAELVLDAPGRQGAIEYMVLYSPQTVAALWKQLQITHVIRIPGWSPGGDEDWIREAVFDRTLYQFGEPPIDRSQWRIAGLAEAAKNATDAAESTHVAWLTCHESPPMGIYSPRDFRKQTPEAKLTEASLSASPLDGLASANAIVLDRKCDSLKPTFAALPAEFTSVTQSGAREVWVRTQHHSGS
jgi:hypothetical protein